MGIDRRHPEPGGPDDDVDDADAVADDNDGLTESTVGDGVHLVATIREVRDPRDPRGRCRRLPRRAVEVFEDDQCAADDRPRLGPDRRREASRRTAEGCGLDDDLQRITGGRATCLVDDQPRGVGPGRRVDVSGHDARAIGTPVPERPVVRGGRPFRRAGRSVEPHFVADDGGLVGPRSRDRRLQWRHEDRADVDVRTEAIRNR